MSSCDYSLSANLFICYRILLSYINSFYQCLTVAFQGGAKKGAGEKQRAIGQITPKGSRV